MSWIEGAKRRAARAAAAHVQKGSVIGLGSGSTTLHFIQIIGSHLKSGKLSDILGIPTSHQAAAEAIKVGIPLTSLDEHPKLDITIDGADQIDRNLDAIKGGGGALLREKVLASASKKFILIADSRKLTTRLGESCPLPIEVLPFAIKPVLDRIRNLGAKAKIRVGSGKLGPVVTDNGNFIIDAEFGAIDDPWSLQRKLKALTGVLETGLFLGLTDIVYIGTQDSVKDLRRPRKEDH